ncbi:MAG: biopolymer transporter ExbD [Planctomycetota bacterium]
MNIRSHAEDDAEVPLSPLIDCVFLLLIFFLVTMMLKRWEYQILLDVPDQTASLSVTKDEEILDLRLDPQGNLYYDSNERDSKSGGNRAYIQIPDILTYTQQIASDPNYNGVKTPVVIRADRETSWKTYLETQDILALQGFKDIAMTIREERKSSDTIK